MLRLVVERAVVRTVAYLVSGGVGIAHVVAARSFQKSGNNKRNESSIFDQRSGEEVLVIIK